MIEKAVSINNGIVSFYPYDLKKYNNMGASSMLIVDFTMRNIDDPDYYNENPQIKINVDGIRLDTFINQHNIDKVDMLCIDLQGYELNAIKSLGDNLKNVKYIITECSIHTTYIDGANFKELNNYLNQYNFKYIISNKFGYNFPDLSILGKNSIFFLSFYHNLIQILNNLMINIYHSHIDYYYNYKYHNNLFYLNFL